MQDPTQPSASLIENMSAFISMIGGINVFVSGLLWWTQKAKIYRNLFLFWLSGAITMVTIGFIGNTGLIGRVTALNFILIPETAFVFVVVSILKIHLNTKKVLKYSILWLATGILLAKFLYYLGLQSNLLYIQPAIFLAAPKVAIAIYSLWLVFHGQAQFSTTGWIFWGFCLAFGLNMLFVAGQGTPSLVLANTVTTGGFMYACSVLGFSLAIEMMGKEKSEVELKVILAQKEAAEKVNRAKSQFLANISHELRTPMHGILSYAHFGLVKTESSKEVLRSYFEEIHVCGDRLMSLLDNLLDLSKLEAGKLELRLAFLEMGEIVEMAVKELKSYATEHGSELQVKLVSASNLCSGDQNRLLQVLRNLITNAVKFTTSGKPITIEVETKNGRVRCSVKNSGVGIPKDELESIFDKFIQSSKTRSNAGGTGLGLAICREIIGLHRGKIWAESGENGDTLLIFELKAKQENNTYDAPIQNSRSASSSQM